MNPIVQFSASLGGLAFASASLFGWGAIVRRLARLPNGSWPVTIALGLSAVLVIGGILNVARIAFAGTLWCVAASGLLFAVYQIARSEISLGTIIRSRWTGIICLEAALVSAFIVLVTIFTIATQLPPDAFNFQDDLQKYFAHPVRQLQTGTVYGSPLSAIGSESLGGIAFLHSFVLSVAPIQFINGVDAVFGLFLVMGIGAAAGWRRMIPLPGALLAPLLIVAINPQYVNVSALYLGAALMGTAVLLTVDEREKYPPSPLTIGLVYSALTALKPTFALFTVLHLPLAATALSLVNGSARAGVLWALRSAAFAALTLSPWVILHLPHYLDATALRTPGVPSGSHEEINLFSVDRLFYGASMANYMILIGLALLVASRSLTGILQDSAKSRLQRFSNLLAAATTVMLAFAILMGLSPALGGYGTDLRFSIPFLLGIVPPIIVISAHKLPSSPSWRTIGIPLTACMAAVMSFYPSFLERYRQAVEYHSILAASNALRMPGYIEYNRAALSTASAQTVRKLQNLIPPGEPFVAWINQPYHFDFRRNPIFDADIAGLATNWAHVPPAVRYVIWQYQGFGISALPDYVAWLHFPGWHVRLLTVRAISFTEWLNMELQKGTIIYSDKEFVVFRR